ncbi:DUF4145 domain-containing protein [Mechercharimyces sp. CAU 1602]|nr:DUF4145 domain-containing protein [Mechercharimyces sp. CAU 1602]
MAALKTKNIDGAICVLALRRTLEMMCIDKGENNRNLYKNIQELSDRDILPPILDGMAGILREVGNYAAPLLMCCSIICE